jgi:hypothetical protein
MKKGYNRIRVSNIFLGMFLTTIVSSCRNRPLQPMKLKIASYKAIKPNPDNPIIYITLLHFYPKQESKGNSVPAVDLYVCRKDGSKDSMFVFDIDNPHEEPNFDVKKDNGVDLIINTHFVKSSTTRSVVANLPQNFIIPDQIEYALTKIYKVTED